jgi:pyruvate dehydrogenase E2 component (dihydrolipoamide acetyltransferase)
MSSSVEMPALGESVTEGTVTRWLKSVGDTVEVDEPLLEVSTDKVDTEIPSPVGGVLQEILVQEDETVEVGAKLAVIGDGSEGGSDDSGSDEQPQQQDEQQEQPETVEPSSSAPVEAEQPSGDQPPASDGPAEDTEQPEQREEPEQQAASSGGGGGGGTEVVMPALGESVTEGTVTRWLKSEGDTVEVDEPLLEVSTDKVDTEIPSPVGGTLQKILVQEDETVEVGAALAVVGDGSGGGGTAEAQPQPQDEKVPDEPQPTSQQEQAPQAEEAQEEKASEPEPEQSAPEAPQDEPREERREASAEQPTSQTEAPKEQSAPQQQPASQQQQSGDAAGYVTPLVRKLASEHGVDLSTLTGTGVGGRIRKQDVLAAAEAAKPAPEPEPEAAPQQAPAASSGGAAAKPTEAGPKRGTTEKMTRLRKVIASRMVESLKVSAQLTTVVEVDLTKVARLRARAKASFEEREGVKLSFLPFLALATVEALKVHPVVNSTVQDDTIVYPAQEHLGIAVDTERGLLVPVIKDAGDLNIAGLARKIADLAARTRDNKVTPDELGGGTFTLTNTGSRGALFDTPIINQPQVAILGTGAVVKRPVVVADSDGGETIAIRSMMYLALSYDHRVVDGADAARFLTTIKDRLEEGAFESDLNL